MAAAGRRRSSRRLFRDQSAGVVVPSTDEKTNAPLEEQRIVKNNQTDSFWGSQLPRPAFLGHADKSAKDIMKENRTRVHYTSSVQPLMGTLLSFVLFPGMYMCRVTRACDLRGNRFIRSSCFKFRA